MKEISPEQLHQLITTNANFQLIDVREDYEFDEVNINGELIPMGDVMDNIDKISRDKQVVMHCRSGKRSATVINALETEHGFNNLYNLTGGVMAYLEKYSK
jgi:rhodanese-related sulfurtransferase